MAKNTELTTTSGNAFTALQNFNLSSAIAEELDGLDLSFDRIKIPSGGSLAFEVPGDDPNEPDTVKEFSAVILYQHPMQTYYKEKYTGGNQPPDCGSLDGNTGIGNPGGHCVNCPLNDFGTGENGAKACKNKRRIYLLREGEIFPILLSLPTGSLKELTKYLKRLISKGRKSNNVITKFTLKKAVNTGGIAYSQAQFAVDRELTPAEQVLINSLTEQVKAYSRNIGFDADTPEAETDMPTVDPQTGEVTLTPQNKFCGGPEIEPLRQEG